MMMTFLRWIVSVVLAVAAVLFALGNRDIVPLTWHPLKDALAVPFFLPVLAALAIGFILGGLVVWLNAAGMRSERRALRRRVAKLEIELKDAEERPATTHNAPPHSAAHDHTHGPANSLKNNHEKTLRQIGLRPQ